MKHKIIFALATITLLSACGEKKKETVSYNKRYCLSDSMKHMIAIDSVRDCNIMDEISLSGEVSFNENNVVKIYPRSSGQVIKCDLSLGDKVHKGEVLAVIKSADIAGNYSDLNSANADLSIAKRQLDNAESLYKSGISSQKEYTDAKESYQKALAAKNKIQAIININGGAHTSAGGTYVLTSPIDGYIVEKKITQGAFIRPDMGDNLFTISDLKNVWIYANVYETDIPKVKVGYEAKVIPMSYPDNIYTGKVDKISQVLDPQSKVMRIRITLDNKDLLLKPDMFAKVIVTNEEGDKSVCIPTSAVLADEGRNYVVVYNNDSDINVSQINILKTVNDKTYINSGAIPGQKLIVKNQLLIFNQIMNQ